MIERKTTWTWTWWKETSGLFDCDVMSCEEKRTFVKTSFIKAGMSRLKIHLLHKDLGVHRGVHRGDKSWRYIVEIIGVEIIVEFIVDSGTISNSFYTVAQCSVLHRQSVSEL